MGAGWLYYHKYPPKRKCHTCGKYHYAKRMGGFSNGEDVWQVFCTTTKKAVGASLISTHGELWSL